jgi:FkbM family methyltransferase
MADAVHLVELAPEGAPSVLDIDRLQERRASLWLGKALPPEPPVGAPVLSGSKVTTFLPGIVAEFSFRDRPVRFFVKNVADVIQSSHANGRFYESDTLPTMERFLVPGGVFLDVGANVGNHAIFAKMFGNQREVITLEPNPEAITLLRLNVILNQLDIDLSHLGVGLSDQDAAAVAVVPHNNLGAARMEARAGGGLKLVMGDSLFAGRHIDFIKVDVEGLEPAVLRGLARTIANSQPTMFIEIDTHNRQTVSEWIQANAYEVAHAFPQYPRTQNVIVRPKTASV